MLSSLSGFFFLLMSSLFKEEFEMSQIIILCIHYIYKQMFSSLPRLLLFLLPALQRESTADKPLKKK
jgi:hypothetical protein